MGSTKGFLLAALVLAVAAGEPDLCLPPRGLRGCAGDGWRKASSADGAGALNTAPTRPTSAIIDSTPPRPAGDDWRKASSADGAGALSAAPTPPTSAIIDSTPPRPAGALTAPTPAAPPPTSATDSTPPRPAGALTAPTPAAPPPSSPIDGTPHGAVSTPTPPTPAPTPPTSAIAGAVSTAPTPAPTPPSLPIDGTPPRDDSRLQHILDELRWLGRQHRAEQPVPVARRVLAGASPPLPPDVPALLQETNHQLDRSVKTQREELLGLLFTSGICALSLGVAWCMRGCPCVPKPAPDAPANGNAANANAPACAHGNAPIFVPVPYYVPGAPPVINNA